MNTNPSIALAPAIGLANRLDACGPSRAYLRGRTVAEAWSECRRADWLLLAAVRLGVDHRPIVMAACACARMALRYVPAGDDRPRVGIETAEAWCRGAATLERVYAAIADAHAAHAFADTYDAAAYDTAYAAAYAATATTAPGAAGYAARATTHAADDAEVVREKSLADMALLVRGHISLDHIAAAIEGAASRQEF